ncbi:hypothetical protein QBC38DRAFT_473384 [Podospora fimiseda]|uniref:Integral membrane protein n=1 Tax=Podospora fimiseda TaxID=252190 RepID=A0AAN7BTE6_9PEZI|nr:hypothetical protein QBC38DRAFT_473384 [Podospora fimiseda]
MEVTLVPQSLPTCVSSCGPLYDVNGACVPPAAPRADTNVYNSCFCNDQRLAPFKSGTSGVCDAACAAPADLTSIRNWFTSYCANVKPTATGALSSTTAKPQKNGGGTWLDNHYQWVIFLVVMVVAIVGIWVGACVWRRRYLRRKDRQYALGANLAHATESGRVVPNESNAGSIHRPGAGMFDPAPIDSALVYNEKPPKEKKKWIVKERT